MGQRSPNGLEERVILFLKMSAPHQLNQANVIWEAAKYGPNTTFYEEDGGGVLKFYTFHFKQESNKVMGTLIIMFNFSSSRTWLKNYGPLSEFNFQPGNIASLYFLTIFTVYDDHAGP